MKSQTPLPAAAAACFLLLVVLPFAASGARAATARTVDDETVVGELVGFDPTPAAVLRTDGRERKIPCSDLVAVDLRPARPPVRRERPAIELRNGDLLVAEVRGGSGAALVAASPLFGQASWPLEAISRIEVLPRRRAPVPGEGKLDRLVLRNGEVVEGTVEEVGAGGVKFRSKLLGSLSVGFERLAAVEFAKPRKALEPPAGLVATVCGVDGSRLSGALGGSEGGKLLLHSPFGPALKVALSGLVRVEFRGGRLVYLSDLAPAEVKETPFFDLVWHYRRDRSVGGNPLRVGGRTFRKGLGVHSRCVLTYALDGRFRRFAAVVGLDDEVGEKGNVDVAVLVDGKKVYRRKGLSGRDEPLKLSIALEGASRLSLVADFGGEFDICDHLDWADARLIR